MVDGPSVLGRSGLDPRMRGPRPERLQSTDLRRVQSTDLRPALGAMAAVAVVTEQRWDR